VLGLCAGATLIDVPPDGAVKATPCCALLVQEPCQV
jgi:hypothetical protein